MKKTWKLGWLLNISLCAGFAVPLDSLDNWKNLKFNKIPQNEAVLSDAGIKLRIQKSSSPFVYKFSEPRKVKSFSVKAKWSGAIKIPEGKTQGEKGVDDFVLKFGLVEVGKETLNWVQKKIAADWILELYKLAPDGTGVRRINFYSTTLQKELLGKKRTHPLSDLLYEERVTHLKGPGEFEIKKEFDEPMESLGLWLSSDGDDTGSILDLEILSIEVQ